MGQRENFVFLPCAAILSPLLKKVEVPGLRTPLER